MGGYLECLPPGCVGTYGNYYNGLVVCSSTTPTPSGDAGTSATEDAGSSGNADAGKSASADAGDAGASDAPSG